MVSETVGSAARRPARNGNAPGSRPAPQAADGDVSTLVLAGDDLAALVTEPGWRRRAVEGSDLVRRAAMKTVQQAEHLVAAARILYYETSGGQFTIQQLSDKAGVSLQTFYRYFRSKDELLVAVLEDYLGEIADQVRADCEAVTDPLERLSSAIRWPFLYMASPENAGYHGLITREHLRLKIEHAAGVRIAGAPYRLLLRDIIDAGAAAGMLPADVDSDRLATFASDLITSQVHNIRLGTEPASMNEMADALARFCLIGAGAIPLAADADFTRTSPTA